MDRFSKFSIYFDKNLCSTIGESSFLCVLIFLTHAIQLTYNLTDWFCLLPYQFADSKIFHDVYGFIYFSS